eukprot:8238814-Pyramimonas_sp.AAC.1
MASPPPRKPLGARLPPLWVFPGVVVCLVGQRWAILSALVSSMGRLGSPGEPWGARERRRAAMGASGGGTGPRRQM